LFVAKFAAGDVVFKGKWLELDIPYFGMCAFCLFKLNKCSLSNFSVY
jgi:hypothetical protein